MKLSLIIPFYNVEKYIEQCILSIIDNNIKNDYEIILVDDGSQDHSYDKIKKYINKKRIKCISQKNAGLGPARNYGLMNAEGEYIWFIDSDDFLPEKAVDQVLDMLQSNQDMIIFNYNYVNENSLYLCNGSAVFNNEENYLLSEDDKKKMLLYPPMSWSRVVKRSIYLKNNIFFPDCKVRYEDLPTTSQLLYYCKCVETSNLKLYNYRVRSNSIMHDKNLIGNKDIMYVFSKMIDFYNEKNCMDEYQIYIKIMLIKHIVMDAVGRVNSEDVNSDIQNELLQFVERYIKIDFEYDGLIKFNTTETIRVLLARNRNFWLLHFFNKVVNKLKSLLGRM